MNIKLLENYIKYKHKYELVIVDSISIDGANCTVKFYLDEAQNWPQSMGINIWDMLFFISENQ